LQQHKGMYMGSVQQFTFSILTDFLNGKVTRAQAASTLQVTERTVTRKAKRLREKGLVGVLHGNKAKTPTNKTCDQLRAKVLDLVRRKYFDFNVVHCLEKLKNNENIDIKYSLLYSWCRSLRLIKRNKRRHTKVRKLRSRFPSEGMVLQMDGSHHAWNGKDEWVLIALIDDATSKIPWAEFFKSEDTLNCMTVLQRVIERFGVPQMIYTDRAGWLGGTTKRDGFNNFLHACEQLGIRVIFANSPQAKGRIERAWDTFQDRLIPELRIHGIGRMDEANVYLQEDFLPNYWSKQNTVPAKLSETGYGPVPIGLDLAQIFCMTETRQVKGDHTISLNCDIYAVTPPEGVSLKGREIEIRTYQNRQSKAFFAGGEIEIQIVHKAPTQKLLRVNNVAGIRPKMLKQLHEQRVSSSTTAQPSMPPTNPGVVKRKRGRPKKLAPAPVVIPLAS
jgi:transposase